jgi:hypothetical protein
MFYQGTLQEGISAAVGQQKLVLCFVTGEDTERSEMGNWADHQQMARMKVKRGKPTFCGRTR